MRLVFRLVTFVRRECVRAPGRYTEVSLRIDSLGLGMRSGGQGVRFGFLGHVWASSMERLISHVHLGSHKPAERRCDGERTTYATTYAATLVQHVVTSPG